MSLFFLRPPDFLGAGLSVVFTVDLSLADFLSEVFLADGFLLAVFFVDFFSGADSTVSAEALLCCSDSPSSTLAKKGAEVPVLMWEIDQQDEINLNHYEGFPRLYRKEIFEMEVNGKIVREWRI